ncbi:MAG: penicillin-binding protein 1B [Pseudomonadota bacterium]
MPRKSSRSRTRRRRGAPFITLFVLGLFIIAGYVAYLDHTVRTQFEGKRWALPARVYARPLELFAGAPLSPAQLAAELADLGYAPSPRLDSPGTFQRNADEFRFITRAFRFWDTAEPSLPVRAVFEQDKLVALENFKNGAPLDLVRLDPAPIGGIYPAHNEDRVLVQLKEVPPLLVQALIAVEDHRYYDHHGIDPISIARALWSNMRAGATVQGGSTLTQQLAKNFYLNPDRTLWRKTNEAIIALLLEYHYSKDEILEAYLNEIFLGQDGQRAIHGFGMASYFYFGRPLNELKLPQFALMVSLVRGASYYDPRRHAQRALTQRNRVLDVMAANKVISAQQAKEAQRAPLGVIAKAPHGASSYPAFMDLLRRQLQRDYKEEDLTSEGLQIFSTLDPQIQRNAERALSSRVAQLEKQFAIPTGRLEGAALVTNSENGEVLAVVGGRDARYSGFNRALDAQRHIGSLIKPAVYLTALAMPQRYTLATLLQDEPVTFQNPGGQPWTPQNYDRQYHGAVPLHAALAHSYNVPTARLGLDVGVANVLGTLKKLGVERDFPAYPSVLLGAIELTPAEVTQTYQTLASGGFRVPLRAIREVLTAKGEPLQRYELSITQAFDPAPVFLLTNALQEVVSAGTARSLKSQLPAQLTVAGKTGTTDDLRDSWFAGFSGQHVAVVWLGRDDNKPTGLSGATGALKVWGDIIRATATQPLQRTAPGNIEYARIDPQTLRRVAADCRDAVDLPFISGSVPPESGPCASQAPGQVDWFREIFR